MSWQSRRTSPRCWKTPKRPFASPTLSPHPRFILPPSRSIPAPQPKAAPEEPPPCPSPSARCIRSSPAKSRASTSRKAAHPRRRRRDRSRHGQVRGAGVPRSTHHRRAADGVLAEFRPARRRARRQCDEAGGQAARHRHERRLQSRQGRQASCPRLTPASVQPRQFAVAFGLVVPRDAGKILAAVGAHRQQKGRQHRVRRHARGL